MSVSLNDSLIILTIGIATTIILISLRRRNAPGATSLIVFALALIVWAGSDFLLGTGVSPLGKLWLSAAYLGATVVPTALLAFSVAYTERGYCLTRRILALLAIEPVLTQALLWITPWQGLFFARGMQTADAAFEIIPKFCKSRRIAKSCTGTSSGESAGKSSG